MDGSKDFATTLRNGYYYSHLYFIVEETDTEINFLRITKMIMFGKSSRVLLLNYWSISLSILQTPTYSLVKELRLAHSTVRKQLCSL